MKSWMHLLAWLATVAAAALLALLAPEDSTVERFVPASLDMHLR